MQPVVVAVVLQIPGPADLADGAAPDGASVKLADPAMPPGGDPAAAYYGAWQPYVVFVPGVQTVSRETCQPEFEMSNR